MRNLLKRKKSTVSKVVALPDAQVESLATVSDRGYTIPKILAGMYAHLLELNGLEEEGIFRVSGTESEMLQVYISASEGKTIADRNPHNVANLMKRWFKSFVGNKLLGEVPLSALQANPLLDVTDYLTEPRLSIFKWLVQVLLELHKHKDKNMMNSRNIAIVWAPSLMGGADNTNMLDILTLTQHGMGLLHNIIENNGNTKLPPAGGAPAAAAEVTSAPIPTQAGALAGVPTPSSPSMSRGRDRSATVGMGGPGGGPPTIAELQFGAIPARPPTLSSAVAGATATPPPRLSSVASRPGPPPRLAPPTLSQHSRSSSLASAMTDLPSIRGGSGPAAVPPGLGPPPRLPARVPPSLKDSQGSSCPVLPTVPAADASAGALPPPPGNLPPPPSPRSSSASLAAVASPAAAPEEALGAKPPPPLTRRPSAPPPVAVALPPPISAQPTATTPPPVPASVGVPTRKISLPPALATPPPVAVPPPIAAQTPPRASVASPALVSAVPPVIARPMRKESAPPALARPPVPLPRPISVCPPTKSAPSPPRKSSAPPPLSRPPVPSTAQQLPSIPSRSISGPAARPPSVAKSRPSPAPVNGAGGARRGGDPSHPQAEAEEEEDLLRAAAPSPPPDRRRHLLSVAVAAGREGAQPPLCGADRGAAPGGGEGPLLATGGSRACPPRWS
eukprot:CAMPEP_0114610896 /NCGR_PEP_ID=MMETSP0168-20121206/3837_1 /TAXON_ID=95228 ORGANISM="Vannella sp., Strain DIVA3 517/6/12" /NCGR_SAMPLE_ID=MMETSP0168 /ASSEMBLY_ACC=CAM_ASM_000044 /LENGTH=674 /DNA_ID=CAMNT_0001821853 /DNA_START=122 /DNA_END=2144 /DNA_ORIENTATION=+